MFCLFDCKRATAIVGEVVSKPMAKKTTSFSGFSPAIRRASMEEVMIRISPPSAFSFCRLEVDPGTLIISRK